jgi:DNA (cytosine-5)-methyltransferase 1
MRVGSTFTGVGGADMGFEWAGMTIAWQCELDKWKRSVLAAHWPGVPIYDDITTLENPEPVDLMVGGFPCQDLSIAGKRKGFSGERSVLAFEFLRLAEALKPRWLVLENVPGLLSSNKGLDFERLLREVVASGYGGIAWRCLDARYFGVPQRRRRIFLVARRTEARFDSRTASGLALRALCEGGSGDLTSCIPPWQDATRTVGGGAEEGRIVGALSARGYTQYTDQEFVRGGQLVTEDDMVAYRESARVSAPGTPETWVDDGRANTLNSFDTGDVRTTHAVVASAYSIREDAKANTFSATPIDAARCLQKQQPSVQSHHAQTFIAKPPDIVRRLSPIECERLMGWPDNWTAPEGVKAPDSRRYAACGDGIVANVAYWIGQRIMQIDKETQ